MSLQAAPVTLSPIPTELITPFLPSTAFIFVMSVCFKVLLTLHSRKPMLSLHPASQTLIASKPGLKEFPGGLGLYLSEINTGGEAVSSRIIPRGKTSPVWSPSGWV